MELASSRTASSSLAATPARPVRRLLERMAPHGLALSVAMVLAVVDAASALALPLTVGRVLDAALGEGAERKLGGEAVHLAVLGVCQIASGLVASVLFKRVAARVIASLRADTLDVLLAKPLLYHHRERTGEHVAMVTSDIAALEGVLGTVPGQLARMPLMVIGGVILMSRTSSRLTLLLGATAPVLLALVFGFGKYASWASRRVQDAVTIAIGTFQETLAGIETVKAFGNEARDLARHRSELDVAVRLQNRRAWAEAAFGALFMSGVFALLIVLFGVGGRMVARGELTGGALIALLGYALVLTGNAGTLADLLATSQSALGAAGRVFDLLSTREPPAAPPLRAARPASPAPDTAAITLEDVEFRHEPHDPVVLSGLRFEVTAGTTCAIVGPSGTGKSTLGRLLCRLYEPTAGRILVHGVDLRTMTPGELRRTVAIVPQETVLFTGTVRENIRYGRPDATDVEVAQAARLAYADEFIERLPDGYDTVVGERGATMSGGQRQRIAIARALLCDPRILILDEATSALDAESERFVRRALETARAGRTTVVIAHGRSAIERADRVVDLGRPHDVRTTGTRGLLPAEPLREAFT